MDDALHAVLERRLADVEGALHVGIHVAVRGHVGVGNGDQRGQVEDDVHVLGDVLAVVRVTHVAVENLDLLAAVHVFQPAPVVEGVVLGQGLDLVAFPHQQFGQM